MKIITTFILLLGLMMFGGCGGDASSSNSNKPPNTYTTPNPTPTIASTANTAVNSRANSMKVPTMPHPAGDEKMSNSAMSNSTMRTANTHPSNSQMSNTNAQATPTAPPQTTEKKDEGLFSFPPPKVIDYSQLEKYLANPDGQTTFSQISKKLADGLDNAGYNKKYSYFWNEKDEFAIVTAMERIKPDGTPLDENERWNTSTAMPKAHSSGEYINYLISGKKVYYRVLAFVITSKRSGLSFFKNSPPDFVTAINWMNKGESDLSSDTSSAIEDVKFTDKYKCFALLYLFVNHTSLDTPKSIDTLKEDEAQLIEGLDKQALHHLKQTKLNFGE